MGRRSKTAPRFTRDELAKLGLDVDAELEARDAPTGQPSTPAAGNPWGWINAHARYVEGRMNEVEKRRARELDADLSEGLIQAYYYERITFRLASRTSYTPDFLVIDAAGLIRFEEIKGDGGWLDSEGRTKWKTTAEQNPWALFVALVEREPHAREPGPLGRWNVEHYKPRVGFPPERSEK